MLEICECQFVIFVVENWQLSSHLRAMIFFLFNQPLILSARSEGRDNKDRIFREKMNGWDKHYGEWDS